MSNDVPEGLGRLDDEEEEHQPSDDAADGAAARGEYDPTEGSPQHDRPFDEIDREIDQEIDEEGFPHATEEGMP